MTNSIVGQSKDQIRHMDIRNQSDRLQLELNRLLQDQLNNHEDRLENLEDTMRVNGVQERRISDAVNRVVVSYLGGHKSKAYEDNSIRARCYSSINREIKNKFVIPRRAELPAKDYEKCLQFINNWILDSDLEDEISSVNKEYR